MHRQLKTRKWEQSAADDSQYYYSPDESHPNTYMAEDITGGVFDRPAALREFQVHYFSPSGGSSLWVHPDGTASEVFRSIQGFDVVREAVRKHWASRRDR